MWKSLNCPQVLSILNNNPILFFAGVYTIHLTSQSSMPVNTVVQTESSSFSHTPSAADVHKQVKLSCTWQGMSLVAQMLATCPRTAA
jgi:hypothetical protein